MLMEFLETVFLQGYFDIAQALKPRTLKYLPMLGRGYRFLEVEELHWWKKRSGHIHDALWKLWQTKFSNWRHFAY